MQSSQQELKVHLRLHLSYDELDFPRTELDPTDHHIALSIC